MCELPSVYRKEKPKARKEHQCYECTGIIPKDEIYHKHSGIWDGSAGTFKICDDCEQLRKDMDKGSDLEDRTPFGCLGEYSSEHDPAFAMRFLAIMRKRGAKIHPSWDKLEANLSNAERTGSATTSTEN